MKLNKLFNKLIKPLRNYLKLEYILVVLALYLIYREMYLNVKEYMTTTSGSDNSSSNEDGTISGSVSDNEEGVPLSKIPPGDEDLYILKSKIVPPVCPKCPDVINTCKDDGGKCPPCPACARCPEPSFECKKVPTYNPDNSMLPKPILNDFSQFGM